MRSNRSTGMTQSGCRTEAGVAALDGLDGVVEINDIGNIQEIRWRGDPQSLIPALAARTRIYQFEITRPSLHDIFVRIAAPDQEPIVKKTTHEME